MSEKHLTIHAQTPLRWEKATPRPWQAHQLAGNMIDIGNGDGSIASVAKWSYGFPGTDEENAVNAALIIEAVNSYDSLRSQLSAAREEVEKLKAERQAWLVWADGLTGNKHYLASKMRADISAALAEGSTYRGEEINVHG